MKCSVEGCPTDAYCRGWCAKHYMRVYRGRGLTTQAEKRREVIAELDRLSLVIDSAVRHADPGNYPAVRAMLRKMRGLRGL